MNDICPNCETEREVESVRAKEGFDVRGTLFSVDVNLLKCKTCGETFKDPKSEEDPIEEAFQQYRRLKKMIAPEEMRAFRQQLGLTQGELGKLLGWGAVTLSRYERGALQDETHDRALRLAMSGGGLRNLVEVSPEVLSKKKREEVLKKLDELDKSRLTFEDIFTAWCDNGEPDEFNGFQRFDTDKFTNAVLFFAKDGVSKTKLNKLLFYADFLSFKTRTKSITGTKYCHLPHGPVPDDYEITYSNLRREGHIKLEPIEYKEDMIDLFKPTHAPDLSFFDPEEIKILEFIKKTFKSTSAKAISDMSHNETAYTESQNARTISYLLAKKLSLDL